MGKKRKKFTRKNNKRKREQEKDEEIPDEEEIEDGIKQELKKRKLDDLKCKCPNERYADFGGIEKIIGDIKRYVHFPFRHPEIFSELKVEPARGILLHGPPGCGKTMLANAIAGELGESISFYRVNAPEIVTWNSGETEEKLRTIFKIAVQNAPSLIFIDEIDSIISKRESSKGMEKRLVSQLCLLMDGLAFERIGENRMVMVIAATNRPETIDTMLRRAGRFDKEIAFGMPDEDARIQILKAMSLKRKIDKNIDFRQLAKITPGYVGADITSLIQEATQICIDRINDSFDLDLLGRKSNSKNGKNGKIEERNVHDDIIQLSEEQLHSLAITMDDFIKAVPLVQPSSKREGFATVPDVTWKDIGSLENVREELQKDILNQINFPKYYEKLGLKEPAGIILFGPPGCGKTLLAKAVANDSRANFISVKGPELLNKYVGETEKAIRTVFNRARNSSPCVIFFDELDALTPKRSGGSVNKVTDRVVNQLLIEMDGLNARKDVYIIAATNRIDIIDSAILRPGRLGKIIYVPLPDLQGRIKILKTILRNTPVAQDVKIDEICKKCVNMSGADLKFLVREASLLCLNEKFTQLKQTNKENQDNMDVDTDVDSGMDIDDSNTDGLIVHQRHFDEALKNVKASNSELEIKKYNRMSKFALRNSNGKIVGLEKKKEPTNQ